MTKLQKTNLRNSLVKVLKAKKIYEKETDDKLIDSYIFNLKIIADAQADVEKRGTMVQMGKDPNYTNFNPAISAINNAIKSNNSILKALGLDKTKLEIDATATAHDAFEAELEK